MRILVAVALASIALAGCTAPEEQHDPLFGVCPQWLDGDDQAATLEAPGEVSIAANASMPHFQEDLDLDRYHVVFTDIQTDGVLEVKAYAVDGDRPLRFTDHRDPDSVRTPTFLALDDGSGSVAVDIFLSDVTHGSQPQPSDLRLEATGQDNVTGSMSVQVTPGYRVCGAVV